MKFFTYQEPQRSSYAKKKQYDNRMLSKEPYVKVWMFEKTEDVTYLKTMNWTVAISILLTTLHIGASNCDFDIGSGPDLLEMSCRIRLKYRRCASATVGTWKKQSIKTLRALK